MEKLLRTLKFLRITDENGDLSLTNIALVIVLVHLLNRPELSLNDLLTFGGALIGYHVKRFVSGAPVSAEDDKAKLQAEIDAIKTKVAGLQLQGSMRK